jgi:oligopeptide/dipeptide ABC transporter ATP-binding protein
VERGPAARVLSEPAHPYTTALLRSVLPDDPLGKGRAAPRTELPVIEGAPPDLRSPPPGCRFQPRCSVAIARCADESPAPTALGRGRGDARCFLLPGASAAQPETRS